MVTRCSGSVFCQCIGYHHNPITNSCDYCDHPISVHDDYLGAILSKGEIKSLISRCNKRQLGDFDCLCRIFLKGCGHCNGFNFDGAPTCRACGSRIIEYSNCDYCGHDINWHNCPCHEITCDSPISKENLSNSQPFCENHYCSNPKIRCIYPNCNSKVKAKHVFCLSHDVHGPEPAIYKIPETHNQYGNVLNQFRTAWKHPKDKKKRPNYDTVEIFFIQNNSKLFDRFEVYKQEIIRTDSEFSKETEEAEPGNVLQRWHGPSNINCKNLLDGIICTEERCIICNVIRNGLSMKYIGTREKTPTVPVTTFYRYGRGIYFTSASSKAHDYTENVAKNLNGKRAVFLCRVIAGKSKNQLKDDRTLCQEILEKQNFHSAVAFGKYDHPLNFAQHLNYDELVVFRDDAILAGYLVVYQQEQ